MVWKTSDANAWTVVKYSKQYDLYYDFYFDLCVRVKISSINEFEQK